MATKRKPTKTSAKKSAAKKPAAKKKTAKKKPAKKAASAGSTLNNQSQKSGPRQQKKAKLTFWRY